MDQCCLVLVSGRVSQLVAPGWWEGKGVALVLSGHRARVRGCPVGQGQPGGCGPVVAGNRAVPVAAVSGTGLTGALFCVCRCFSNPSDKEVLRGGKQGGPPSSGMDREWDWVKKIMATAASGSGLRQGRRGSPTECM